MVPVRVLFPKLKRLQHVRSNIQNADALRTRLGGVHREASWGIGEKCSRWQASRGWGTTTTTCVGLLVADIRSREIVSCLRLVHELQLAGKLPENRLFERSTPTRPSMTGNQSGSGPDSWLSWSSLRQPSNRVGHMYRISRAEEQVAGAQHGGVLNAAASYKYFISMLLQVEGMLPPRLLSDKFLQSPSTWRGMRTGYDFGTLPRSVKLTKLCPSCSTSSRRLGVSRSSCCFEGPWVHRHT